ncbi:EAL domain-containing protein [Vibrio sp. D420a]|uniref:EAL domain-containing protein n=1 Tax=Vibrio sp. D420a TaxID=2836895 RepID=UPI0025543E44|nr:EAL domain-containing protein [Vibrio sp. D420a]MDK9764700.1 EAL domain-containing protein [Vibrio sp. D420a]
MAQDTANPMESLFQWRWDVHSNEFKYDEEAFSLLFQYERPIKHAHDILTYFTSEQVTAVQNAIAKARRNQEPQRVICTMRMRQHSSVLGEFVVDKVEKESLSGYFQPLIIIPSGDELASLFLRFFDNASQGIVITDNTTRILACNTHFERQTGFLRRDILGLKVSLLSTSKHSPLFYASLWAELNQHGFWSGTLFAKKSNGMIFPQELTVQKLTITSGESFFFAMTTDLSQDLARLDENINDGYELLTLLPSKEKFLFQLEALFESNREASVAILAFSPELSVAHRLHEKKIIAQALERNPHVVMSGYLGEGIFSVCIEVETRNTTERTKKLKSLIKDLLKELKFHLGEYTYQRLLNTRVGGSVLGMDAACPNQCLEHALEALKEPLPNDNSLFNFYSKKKSVDKELGKAFEEWLKTIVDQQLLSVHYLPTIDANTGRISAFEAICTFPQYKGQEVILEEVITLLEELNLIVDVYLFCNRLALVDYKQIQQIFGDDVQLILCFSTEYERYTNVLLDELIKWQEIDLIDLNNILIRVNEKAVLESNTSQAIKLDTVRHSGGYVLIDEIGFGYSSVSFLKANHFDYIKLHHWLVHDLEQCDVCEQVLNHLVGLCQTLKVQIVAEGLSSQFEVLALKNLGVQYMQGPIFSEPLCLEQLSWAMQFNHLFRHDE